MSIDRQLKIKEIKELVDTALDHLREDISSLVNVNTSGKETSTLAGNNRVFGRATGDNKSVTHEISDDDLPKKLPKDMHHIHTHPTEGKPIPSFQDLISTIKAHVMFKTRGTSLESAIVSKDNYFISMTPTDRLLNKIGDISGLDADEIDKKIESSINNIKNTLESGDREEIIKKLEQLGFKVKTN